MSLMSLRKAAIAPYKKTCSGAGAQVTSDKDQNPIKKSKKTNNFSKIPEPIRIGGSVFLGMIVALGAFNFITNKPFFTNRSTGEAAKEALGEVIATIVT